MTLSSNTKLFFLLTAGQATFLCGKTQKNAADNSAIWFSAKLRYNFNKKYSWDSDAGSRFFPAQQVLLFRTGLTAILSPHISVTNGAAVFHTKQTAGNTDELRLYHYFIVEKNTAKLFFRSRLRIEERIFLNNKAKSFRERAGQLFQSGINIPAGLKGKPARIFLWNEYFTHLGEPSFFKYDQNRSGVTWEQSWSPVITSSAGLIYQDFSDKSPVWIFSAGISINYKKK